MNTGLYKRGFKFYAGIIAGLMFLTISLLKTGIPAGAAISPLQSSGISLSPEILADPFYTMSYSQTITAEGGIAPYTFAVTSGALPPGLSLSSSGDISGTPSGPGGGTVTITATDAASATGSRTYQLRTFCSPSFGFIDTTAGRGGIPVGTVGSPYSLTFTADGCAAPYAFSSVGTLPPGLTLASGGTLSGTPESAGSYTFTVKAIDAHGFKITKVYTLFMVSAFQCPDLNFSAPTDIGPSSPAQTTASGDFNGDGILDSATLDASTNEVLIRLGNGDGTFQAPLTYPTNGASPSSVTTGDFNRDRTLDLAVANSGSDNVSILLGNGSGGMENTVTIPAGDNPLSIAVGDFNGDSILDLATANSGSDNVTVLLGDGFGNFPASMNFSLGAGASPRSVRVLDFNADGKTDIAVGKGNGVEAVLLNSCSLPSIASFTPAAGAVGTTVTITGSAFSDVTDVSFNGTSATFTIDSDSQITAVVPSGATTGKISVANAAGTDLSATDFIVAPTVESFSPASGAAGASVSITGLNFGNASSVKFNGTSATFTIDSNTQITAVVPSGATTGKISVTNAAGTALSADDFIVIQTPTVASFSPASGIIGTSVTINGTNFTDATEVKFNGTSATFTIDSNTQITATAPSGGTTGKISVTTTAGTALSATDFKYTPSVNAFAPTTQLMGGVVTVTGFNLKAGVVFGSTDPRVRINNGNPATVLSSSATEIVFVVPLGATTGRISVQTADGTGVSADDLIVNPTLFFGFDPTSASIGATVTLIGYDLGKVTEVKFNGVSASFSVVPNPTDPTNNPLNFQINATVPAGATTGQISVTNSVGTITNPTVFRIAPRIDSFTPTAVVQGDPVTITGINLKVGNETPIAGVSGVGGSVVLSATETQIVFTAPPTSNTFSEKLIVVTSDGSNLSANKLVVLPVPVFISEVFPSSAPIGATVEIHGKGLSITSSLKFNGVSANFTVVHDTLITAVVPAGAATGPVTVTNQLGTAASPTNFKIAPRVDSFTPTLASQGTSVTVTGINLKVGTATPLVNIGGLNAAVISATDTQIVFTTPSVSDFTGQIVITTADGSGSSANNLVVIPPVSISGVVPSSAPIGATVAINGVSFLSASSVKFNGVSANFTVVHDTLITAVVPAGAATGPVTVTNQFGTAASPTVFKIAPRIDSISSVAFQIHPQIGVITKLTIRGLNLRVGNAKPVVKMGFIVFNENSVFGSGPFEIRVEALGIFGGNNIIEVSTSDGTSNQFPINIGYPPVVFTPGYNPTAKPGGAISLSGIFGYGGVTNVFFTSQGGGFGNTSASFSYGPQFITIDVPPYASYGPILFVNDFGSTKTLFPYCPLPEITSFSPTTVQPGDTVTILGKNLSIFGNSGKVYINDKEALPITYSSDNTQLRFTVPAGAITGWIKVVPRDNSVGYTKTKLIVASNAPINTNVGSNVAAAPVDPTTGTSPATVTFSNVAVAGTTTLTTSNDTQIHPSLPSGFALGSPPTYYDLVTTASFTGEAEVCIRYSGVSFSNQSPLKLLHYEDDAWVDRTTSIDTVNKKICALVTSFSPFAIVQPATAAINVLSAFQAAGGSTKTPLDLDLRVFDKTALSSIGILIDPINYEGIWNLGFNLPDIAIEDLGNVAVSGGMAKNYKFTVPSGNPDFPETGSYLVIGRGDINTGTTTATVYIGSPTDQLAVGNVASMLLVTSGSSTAAETIFLHSIGSALSLNNAAPTGTADKFKDSTGVNFNGGNPWKEVGTWTAAPAAAAQNILSFSDLRVWLGLKNSDDQGTRFDIRAEIYKNGVLTASGENLCITDVTRNPNLAKEVALSFGQVSNGDIAPSDVLSLKILTRIGTNGGALCGGHSNATGLRLYFDSTSKPSKFTKTF